MHCILLGWGDSAVMPYIEAKVKWHKHTETQLFFSFDAEKKRT